MLLHLCCSYHKKNLKEFIYFISSCHLVLDKFFFFFSLSLKIKVFLIICCIIYRTVYIVVSLLIKKKKKILFPIVLGRKLNLSLKSRINLFFFLSLQSSNGCRYIYFVCVLVKSPELSIAE